MWLPSSPPSRWAENARLVEENNEPRWRRHNRFFGFNHPMMTSLAKKNPLRASSHPCQSALAFFAPANESVVLTTTTTAVVVIYVNQINMLYRTDELARFWRVHSPRYDNNNIWRTTTESACWQLSLDQKNNN